MRIGAAGSRGPKNCAGVESEVVTSAATINKTRLGAVNEKEFEQLAAFRVLAAAALFSRRQIKFDGFLLPLQ